MATVTRFEDLEIWQIARRLAKEIFLLTLSSPFKNDFGLKNQMNNSANSIMSNIAEGFERSGNNEFMNFLSIAEGSCGEICSQLYVALDRNYINNEKFDLLQTEYVVLEKRIGKFMKYLKESEVKGFKIKNRNSKQWMAISKTNSKPETTNPKPDND